MYRVVGLHSTDFTPTVDSVIQLVHPDDRDKVKAWVRESLDLRAPVNFEHRVQLPDGSIRHIHARNRVLLDDNGAPVKVVGTAQDVTERTRAEAALRLSEERYRLVSQATNDVLWDWELATGLVTYNRAFREGFAPASHRAIPHAGMPMENVHPDDLPQIRDSLADWLGGDDDAWIGEYRMRLADGSDAFVLDRALVQRDADGVAIRVVGTMMDVSEQKLHEQELRQAKNAAESANNAKSDFLTNMSHEIRTPMNGVLGALGLLLDSELSGSQRELAGLARSSGETLLSLINDILDFSKDRSRQDGAGADSVRPVTCVRSGGRHDGDARRREGS